MTPTHPPAVPLAVANTAATAARRSRAEALLAVTDGLLAVTDVILQASNDTTGALSRIRLRQLLLSQPGWGTARAEQTIKRTLAILETEMSDRAEMLSLAIGWLLDSRTGGNRLAAFCDAITPTRHLGPPWEGFPYRARAAGAHDH